MSRINILDKSVYNRIAAGEVIERPFSVVKELIENSIDAGATEISVAIEDGGKSFVRVTDDGSGIEKDDLPKAFLPHATSKIKDADDLERIMTLGFRGEALASVAAVSKVTITTKTAKDEIGNSITANYGEIGDAETYPSNKGTTVCVENLFSNIPARAKFLKPAKNEEADITNIITRLMLANPYVAFRYSSDGKDLLQTSGRGLDDALIEIYGYDAISDCIAIETVKNGIRISGFIGKQYFVKPNRTYQTVILNGRYVINGTIQSAIHNAYAAYLMKRKYPFYVLNIEIPPDAVDVNVHPNKTDVRFTDNQVIYSSVYSVISKVLDGSVGAEEIIKKNSMYLQQDPGSRPVTLKPKKRESEIESVGCDRPFVSSLPPFFSFGDEGNASYEKFKAEIEEEEKKKQSAVEDIFAENKKYIEELDREKEKEVASQGTLSAEEDFRVVGQVLTTYVVLERGDEVYFIDQHAAHERLLYDKFIAEYEKGKITEQPILVPYEIITNEKETEFLIGKLDYLHSLGVEIVESDLNRFNVYSVPFALSDMDIGEFIGDILSDMSLRQVDVPDVIREKLAQKACKAAIKSGKVLSDAEMKVLLDKLKDNMGLRCPHGRPVAIKITRKEIDKWFKRIV